jgi:plastocyanin
MRHTWGARRITTKTLVALALGLAAAATPLHAGDVHGHVTLTGTAPAPKPIPITKDQAVCGKVEHLEDALLVSPDKGIKNVVVRVADPGDGKPAPAAEQHPVLEQNGCRFVPRVMLIPAGAVLDLVNSDGILHNIHTWSKANPSFNRAQPKFVKVMNTTFEKPEIMRISCDVHPWMSGWIVVEGHPYYAISDDRGNFTIAGVPPGPHTLEVWHETLGVLKKSITVPASGAVEVAISFALPAAPPGS